MNKILIFLILIFRLNCFSQTQQQMRVDTDVKFRNADKELNRVYKQILSEYKTDTLFIENLKKSQRIWIDFRDAEIEMRFPKNQSDNGSVTPTCRLLYLTELTEKRTETLKKWLIGVDNDGDICNRTIKMWEPDFSEETAKAYVEKDGSVWLTANMQLDYMIFGYEEPDKSSKKLILISIFTDDVQNNPFGCKYGAYYDTNGMNDLKLVYLSTLNDFLEIALTRNGQELDKVYMDIRWFEFEQ